MAFCNSTLFFSRYRSVMPTRSSEGTHSVVDIGWFGEFQGIVLGPPVHAVVWILFIYRVYPDDQSRSTAGNLSKRTH
jgi:hypothetical protein